MGPATHQFSISGVWADAVFASALQRCEQPSAGEIRLLGNLETPRGKLLQIILAGQPELDRKLDARVTAVMGGFRALLSGGRSNA